VTEQGALVPESQVRGGQGVPSEGNTAVTVMSQKHSVWDKASVALARPKNSNTVG